jgi:hypothetical protein
LQARGRSAGRNNTTTPTLISADDVDDETGCRIMLLHS